jgi:hypothetical protein
LRAARCLQRRPLKSRRSSKDRAPRFLVDSPGMPRGSSAAGRLQVRVLPPRLPPRRVCRFCTWRQRNSLCQSSQFGSPGGAHPAPGRRTERRLLRHSVARRRNGARRDMRHCDPRPCASSPPPPRATPPPPRAPCPALFECGPHTPRSDIRALRAHLHHDGRKWRILVTLEPAPGILNRFFRPIPLHTVHHRKVSLKHR